MLACVMPLRAILDRALRHKALLRSLVVVTLPPNKVVLRD